MTLTMSAGCMRRMLSHTVGAVCGGGPGCRTPAASRFLMCAERFNIVVTAAPWRGSLFSTTTDETEQAPPPKQKERNHWPKAEYTNVGRKIPYPHIQLISETGENMGVMHRANVIQVMNTTGLRLVMLDNQEDPPVYRLMSGKEIYEENMKQVEKQKGKGASIQVKELSFSVGIGAHDLEAKLKQVESWLKKKYHVRMTLQPNRRDPKDNLDTKLEQMVQQMEVKVGFVSKPRPIRDGRAAMCIIRPLSAKELSQQKKAKDEPPPPSPEPSSPAAPRVSSTESTTNSQSENN